MHIFIYSPLYIDCLYREGYGLVTTKAPPRRLKKVITVTYTYAPALSPSQAATRPPRASGSAWPLALPLPKTDSR